MTRDELLTRRAAKANELDLLMTAAYWERVRDGRADAEDKAFMREERDAAYEDVWAEFYAHDLALVAEFNASKEAA
ncbi:hypothetical protein [Asticcacaulis endophyticus]|uniref:Uncharacterized protein n=1 Tax=Asticcacaulis endophyticus TaxID=1395890 RepID=A0A918PV67_9CAUL|nr:hypothetical protein [Asticcacaulis endophyticus]GGZ21953.1 hypothetical protein GCM10011273_03440 [Asticcacaulis endophyticus]